MALVPLEGELKSSESGVLDLTDRQVQQAGVRFGKVSNRNLVKEIDTFGEIHYDERRLSRITSWIPGRVEKLYVNITGERVEKGDPLVSIYSLRRYVGTTSMDFRPKSIKLSLLIQTTDLNLKNHTRISICCFQSWIIY